MSVSIKNNTESSVIVGGKGNTINHKQVKGSGGSDKKNDGGSNKTTIIATICTVVGTLVAIAALFVNSK